MYNLSSEQLQKIARTIYAEAGVLKGNFSAHLAVGQCIRDIWETKELGAISLEEVLERAFNGKSEVYDDESLQAARAVFEQGVVRYPNARIIQFRSFTNYGMDGNPDKEKLKELYKNYVYLGKDSVGEQGHFYFGRFRGMRILLDPGHYGSYYNQSPAVPEYYESNFTWKFHLLLKAELERKGAFVGTTRANKDDNPGLVARGMMAKGYDVLVSLHSNAVGSGVNEQVDHPLAFVMMDDQNPMTVYDQISQELGLKLARAVGETMGCEQLAVIATKSMGADRNGDGVVNAEDEYYAVLYGARQVGVPAVILEHSFHTNTRSTRWLMDDENLQKLAEAEANAILEYQVARGSYQICNGTIRISYGGTDGVNLHSSPDLRADSVIGTLYYNSVRRAVGIASLPDGTTMYRLEDGEYITASGSYVQYTSNGFNNYVAKVTADTLNVRDFPSSLAGGGRVMHVLGKNNLVEVTGEAYNNGQKWLMVRIRNAEVNITGFVAAAHMERV